MKFLIIGDVVGEPGRNILFKYLEKRKQNYDFIIVNAENCLTDIFKRSRCNNAWKPHLG